MAIDYDNYGNPVDFPDKEDLKNTTFSDDPVENFTTDIFSVSPVDAVLGAFGFRPDEGRELLIRTGIIVLGAALILIGVSMVISGSKTASAVRDTVVGTAVDLIPAGKVAKVAKKVI